MSGIFEEIQVALELSDPAQKCQAVAELALQPEFEFSDREQLVVPIGVPGRPRRPKPPLRHMSSIASGCSPRAGRWQG